MVGFGVVAALVGVVALALVGVAAQALVGVVALALVGVVNTAVETCRFQSRAGLVPPFFTHCAVGSLFDHPANVAPPQEGPGGGSASGPMVAQIPQKPPSDQLLRQYLATTGALPHPNR